MSLISHPFFIYIFDREDDSDCLELDIGYAFQFYSGVCKGEKTRVKEKNHLHKAEVEATFAKKSN